MQIRILTIVLAGLLAASPTFAQSTDNTNSQSSTQSNPESARHAGFMGALKGGGIGCLAGGILGALTHHNALRSCAIGGAAGAVIGGVRGYRQQLDQARELSAQAQDSGIQTRMTTRTVVTDDERGQSTQTQALDHLTLNLDADRVRNRDAGVAVVLAKAAHLADASSVPVTLRVAGTASERDWIADTLRANLKSDTTAGISEVISSTPSLVISPVPNVGRRVSTTSAPNDTVAIVNVGPNELDVW